MQAVAQVMEGARQELRLVLVAGGRAVARAAASISSSNACGGDELTAVLAEHAAALKDLQVRGYVALLIHHASHDCMHAHVSRHYPITARLVLLHKVCCYLLSLLDRMQSRPECPCIRI